MSIFKFHHALLTLVWCLRLLRCGLFPASRNNRLPFCFCVQLTTRLSASGISRKRCWCIEFSAKKGSEFWDLRNVFFYEDSAKLQTPKWKTNIQTNNSNSWTDQATISTFLVHRGPNNNSIFRRIFIIELTAKCSCGIVIWSNFVELRTFCESRYECVRWRVVVLI